MSNYIDGFAFPISKDHLDDYKLIAEQVASIWKEHGAIAYFEYIKDDLELPGTLPFDKCLEASENETIIFGWVVFSSKGDRDLVNEKVATDKRIATLVQPIMDPSNMIFNPNRMAFASFKPFINIT